MKKHPSLQRIFNFYTLSLMVMLAMYYLLAYTSLVERQQIHTQTIFARLLHEIKNHNTFRQDDVNEVLDKPFLSNTSYQLMVITPSGQIYIHDYYRPDDKDIEVLTLPESSVLEDADQFTIDNDKLSGWIVLDNDFKVYVNLYHQPLVVEWRDSRYWAPLLITFVLFMAGLLLVLRRRNEWELLIRYTESLSLYSKESYLAPPFPAQSVAKEFMRIGHGLSRINYQLHKNYRRTQLLSHRLERLIDYAPLPMATLKRHGQISFLNPRFEQVFGTSFQRSITYTLTDFVTGIDKATHQTLTKLTSQRVTRTLLVKGLEDNQTFQLHIMPWFGEHGQIHGFTAILNSVNNLSQQLDDAQATILQQQSRLTDFDQLWSVMGHELRTPLSGMIGMLELLDSEGFDEEQKETFVMLEQTSQAMLSMLNGMLDMAKLDAGKLKVEEEVVDVLAVCQQICELMVGNARRQGIELHYFFDPQCPRYLTTDVGRLRQILMNLIGNAIKFTQTGYVALIIEPITTHDPRYVSPATANKVHSLSNPSNAVPLTTLEEADLLPLLDIDSESVLEDENAFAIREAEPSIEVSGHYNDAQKGESTELRPDNEADFIPLLSNRSQWLSFSVKDTGIGIEPEEQSKLFSFFNQANDSISRQFGGTGLGLAISNSFAQLLGGFIHLDSIPGQGSTFSLCLPKQEPSYQPVYLFNTDLSNVCLIAFLNQEISAYYLNQLCNHVGMPAIIETSITTSNIVDLNRQLLSAKAAQLTCIILMDYELFENSDTQLLSQIPDYLDYPKILLSMMPERGIVSQIIEQFDGYLSKPLDMGHLISEVSRLSHSNWRRHSTVSSVSNAQASFNDFLAELSPSQRPHSDTAFSQYQTVDSDAQLNENVYQTSYRQNSAHQSSTPLNLEVQTIGTHQQRLEGVQNASSHDSGSNNKKDTLSSYVAPNVKNAAVIAAPIEIPPSQDLVSANENEASNRAVSPEAIAAVEAPLILVAEDNPINQKVACKVLEKLGYRTIVAANGEEAINTLKAHRNDIQLILMDCRMPIMDGLSATAEIRANHDSIPIIALTANDTDEDRSACLKVGMNSFLSKPLKKDQLAQAIKQFLID
ncbi:MAG: response regulator [Psychrobacter sp.]|nr:response regulator [Psychrobacter sp.]